LRESRLLGLLLVARQNVAQELPSARLMISDCCALKRRAPDRASARQLSDCFAFDYTDHRCCRCDGLEFEARCFHHAKRETLVVVVTI